MACERSQVSRSGVWFSDALDARTGAGLGRGNPHSQLLGVRSHLSVQPRSAGAAARPPLRTQGQVAQASACEKFLSTRLSILIVMASEVEISGSPGEKT